MLSSSFQNRYLRIRFLLVLLPSFPVTVPLAVTINSSDTPVGAGFLSTIIIALVRSIRRHRIRATVAEIAPCPHSGEGAGGGQVATSRQWGRSHTFLYLGLTVSSLYHLF